MDWAETTARRDKKYLIWGFGATYTRGFTVLTSKGHGVHVHFIHLQIQQEFSNFLRKLQYDQ